MVPNGWEYTTLESLCDKDSPITYGVLKPGKYCEGGTPLLQIKDLLSNLNNVENIHKIPAELDFEYRRSKIKTNDILISLVGTVGRIGIVPSTLDNANIHRNLGRIRTKCFEYLVHYLNSDIAKNRIGLSSSGSSQSALNLSVLRSLKVPIPPLPEQQKIAKILSTWDKAIVTTEKLIATSQQQKKALMQQLLTGKKRLVRSPEKKGETGKVFEGDWKVTNLGSLAQKIGSGVTPKGGSESYKLSGIPLIRSQNVLWGKIDLSDVAYIDKEQHQKMKGSVVLRGDVLLNITGASIGRVAVSDLDEANVNQHVCIIRSNVINPEYLKNFLLSFRGQKQIEQFQAGGNRQGLNFEQIKSFKIFVCSLSEQQKIASVLTAADKEIELLESKLTHFNQEKRALMQQLLTGKRRVKIN